MRKIGTQTKSFALAGILALGSFSLVACSQAVPDPQEMGIIEPGIADSATTDTGEEASNSTPTDSNQAIAWEALMGPDGEYAAAASYAAVLAKFGDVEPYLSIYEAELRHISALSRQLERMGLTVPENPYLGKVEAPEDLETAAAAWAEGEILNVEMYDELIAQASDASLIRVLNNLRRASLEQHLPAFEEAAANGGVAK